MRRAVLAASLLAGCNVITPDLLNPSAVDAPASGDATPQGDASGPDLLLRYDFEGDGVIVTDSSPRALDGRLSDGNAWTAAGRTGRGIALAGGVPATQYVSLPTGVLTGVDDFTIAVWVKLNSTTAWGRVYDIGNGLADPANRFMYLGLDGALDDFRIYGRRLSQAEIADLAWPKTDYAYWRFDEPSGASATDSSDFAIPATLFDGVTRTDGRIGGAVDFPGGDGGATSPRIVLGSSPFAGCTTQLTVAAWIKLRALSPWARVFDFGTSNTSFIYLAPTDGTGMHFAMVSPAGLFDLVTPTVPLAADAQWHHVAVTVDAANLVSIYVDGKIAASATSPTVRPSDFTSLTENWLGRSRFGDPTLNGAIDELRTSCRAFTADEIKNLARK
ncbi:MAG: LamG domain-containing protein [Deltaproteobacteria bacterium]|nr:LamG domain-containing protein [Deltaproteobacteria bacterium]